MPLPHSGAGGTLIDSPPARPAPALASHGTLFGIAPDQLTGGAAAPEAPAGARPPLTTGAAAPEAPAGARPPLTTGAGGVPGALQADAPVPQRTLLGVMPDEMLQALAGARQPALPRGATPESPPEPMPQPPAALRFDRVLGGATLIGTPAAPALGAPVSAGRDAAPAAARGGSPEPERTVRSASHPAAPAAARASAEPFGSSTIEVEPEPLAERVVPREPPPQARTHLGVAVPGIAPLRASLQRAPAAPRSPLEETRLQPEALPELPPLSAPPTAALTASSRRPPPRGALVLLGSGLLLSFAAAAFALLWKPESPVAVAIAADGSGKDRLDIRCEECPDGTLIALEDAQAEFAAHDAHLTLARPLPLGQSQVTFQLRRPGAGEAELVELTLPPVEYRIRPDTSSLTGDQPRLTLDVHALPGSAVEIARQAVPLDAHGRGAIAVDVTGQLIGPASEVTTFEQAIAYAITPPAGERYEGELSVKIGVTPLVLEAPGADTVTQLERFMLAGRTSKGAELYVAGATLPVDERGRFAQLMSIDAVGETRVTVRATQPGLAPRFVAFRLQRVSNLQQEAALRRQRAAPLAEVRGNIADHIGRTVVVTGQVEEARSEGHRTLIILQAQDACAGSACLSRLVYGGLRKLTRGETITALGRLQGAVGGQAGPGEIPDIDVTLLL